MQPSTGHAHVQVGLFMLRFHFRLRHFVNWLSFVQHDMVAHSGHSSWRAFTSVGVRSAPRPGPLYSGRDCHCNGTVAQPGQQFASPKHTASLLPPHAMNQCNISPGLLTILLVIPIWVADPQSPSPKVHISWGPF